MLSTKALEIVKAMLDEVERDAAVARMMRIEWASAVMQAGEALGLTTARDWSIEEITDALSGAIDRAESWSKAHLTHIREYFILTGRPGWSHSDLLIALVRLRENASADPLVDCSIVGGGK